MNAPPTIADVRAARRRLAGAAVVTPLVRATHLSERLERPVFVKAETLQLTGSFKFRGAWNRVAALTPDERARGVVAFSSGNHAQGVAAAAARAGISALIVMPSDAPRAKIDGARELGAEIVLYDRATESREAIASRIAAERGAVLIPSFDDPYVIAGQGTAGLEIAEQVAAAGERLDCVATPVGGGGLASGLALAIAEAAPGARLVGVEPAGFDDAARSLAAGRIVANVSAFGSAQDALLTPKIGDLTFAILSRVRASLLTVSDAEALSAVSYAARRLKLVAEPGGAAALAAALEGRLPPGEGALAVVLSGGNVDAESLASALAS